MMAEVKMGDEPERKRITAEAVLRLLLRSALHFVHFAWELLGKKKKIVSIDKK